MQLGMIGLGRMGANMVRRLAMQVGIAADHGGFDLKEDLAARLRTERVVAAARQLVGKP